MKARLKHALLHYWKIVFHRQQLEDELAEEIELHIEELTEDYQRQGMSREAARKAARIRFGGIERIREECRDSWTNRLVSGIWRDLRLATRTLARKPNVSFVAILTLAIGIGLNTSMFGILNGFVLRPLSYPDSHQLFRLFQSSQQNAYGNMSYVNFRSLADGSDDIAQLAAYTYWGFTLSDGAKPPEMPQSMRVTSNFLSTLGARVQRGRAFKPEDGNAGNHNVIVISHDYWRGRFDQSESIIGKVVNLDGQPVEIIGVMAPDDSMTRAFSSIELFRPLGLSDSDVASWRGMQLAVVGRYHDGVTSAVADTRFAALADRLAKDYPLDNRGLQLTTLSLQTTALMGSGLSATYLLIGLSGLVLLIACSNLANILLANAIGRLREFSVRAALGASRGQLIRPLIAECLLLALAGGFAAILIAIWATKWIGARFAGTAQPIDFSPDIRVFGFALATSVFTALIFGAAPALWAARIDVNQSLKSGGRGSTDSKSHNRYRSILIGSQFALALVLLAGSAFFIRGVRQLTSMDLGWEPVGVVEGTLNLATPRFHNAEAITSFHRQLQQRLLQIPGVENAGWCYSTPLFGGINQRVFVVPGREPPPPGEENLARVNGVSPSYFGTLKIRLLDGRLIDERDTATGEPVVVINESMAKALFPGESSIGKALSQAGFESETQARIVGVVEDTRPMFVVQNTIPFEVYKPHTQEPWQYGGIAVRVSNPNTGVAILESIRDAVASLDSDIPVLNLMPTPQRIIAGTRYWRTINQLLLIFAAVGILLAALGIYGVVTRYVAQRKVEIGIRMALGARPKEIGWLVMGRIARVALAGTLVGLIGAYCLHRYLVSELPGIGSGSPLPIAFAAVALIAVALGACQLPSRRAARVNPARALVAE